MRVLICDDNEDAANTLGVLLRLERHHVVVCHDGFACVEEARRFKPEVTVIDIGMPGMSGYQVATAIRAMKFGGEVLMLAYTGWGTADDVRMAIDAGFDLHLTKPADAERLVRLVKRGRRAQLGN
jgi:DNA-binding response OmpR family regulator